MAQVVGVAWYSRAAWERLRGAVPDPEVLEARYEAWQAVYAKGIADLRRAGLGPERVDVDAEAFLAWCVAHDRAPDSDARAQYAADQMRERYERKDRRGG